MSVYSIEEGELGMTIASGQSSRSSRDSLALSIRYAAPDGELETLITDIFAEVFTLDRVGAEDDFFDLGEDSLAAEVLCALVPADRL